MCGHFLMQNAECKMQNEGSLRSENIRLYIHIK